MSAEDVSEELYSVYVAEYLGIAYCHDWNHNVHRFVSSCAIYAATSTYSHYHSVSASVLNAFMPSTGGLWIHSNDTSRSDSHMEAEVDNCHCLIHTEPLSHGDRCCRGCIPCYRWGKIMSWKTIWSCISIDKELRCWQTWVWVVWIYVIHCSDRVTHVRLFADAVRRWSSSTLLAVQLRFSSSAVSYALHINSAARLLTLQPAVIPALRVYALLRKKLLLPIITLAVGLVDPLITVVSIRAPAKSTNRMRSLTDYLLRKYRITVESAYFAVDPVLGSYCTSIDHLDEPTRKRTP